MADRAAADRRSAAAPRPARWPVFLAAVALAYLVFVVFWPIVRFEFVDLDVPRQVIGNPYIRGLTGENLKHLLTSPSITSYYPVRTLTYAVDYRIWGLDPFGFKLTNALIHAANVLLVFWLVRRLFRQAGAAEGPGEPWWDVPVAALAAGLFAVHPVVVEPVVWVAGREELLMTLGALGCLHFHLAARRLQQRGGSRRRALACHAGAAVCCAAACLSNAVAAVIPLLIATWDLLMLSRPKLRKMLASTWALWAIGAATIAIKHSGESRDWTDLPRVFTGPWVMTILSICWRNLRALVWPTRLAAYYTWPFPQSFLDPEVMLGGLLVVVTGVALWTLRQRKLILFGLLWFALALGPTSQIMPHHIPRADRFLYLPLVGLVVAAAAGLRPLRNAFMLPRPQPRRASTTRAQAGHKFHRNAATRLAALLGAIAVGVLGLLLLVMLSAGQVQTWQDSLSMWQNCLEIDPNNATAHGGLADNLAKRGQFDQAVRHYQTALRIDPDEVETLKNFALLLATCPDERLRDYDLALRLAERACRSMRRPDPAVVMALAEVYAQRGETEMTIATTKKAIRLARAAGDDNLADELERRLALYESNVPARRPPY